MPDIQLRFQRDMLVLSAPIDTALARQGVNVALDRQYLNLMEPEAITDALRLETIAGAQCVVATTEDITQARLAHLRMDADAQQLAHAAITAAQRVKPQHLLVEIGPCGLPLDASSKASLNENRAQYANAARAFADEEIDAFFLNGFSSIADLKCALMGLAQVSDRPVFASVALGRCDWTAQEADAQPEKEQQASRGEKPEVSLPFGGGYVAVDETIAPPLPAASRARLALEAWLEAIDAMADLGASVVGFETADPIADALTYAKIAVERTNLPVLAQLRVTNAPSGAAAKNLVPLEDIDEYTPDTMANAAVKLYGAGVQFLRATGAATPAYTGALAATVTGLDVRRL